jgi:hypothetical protein
LPVTESSACCQLLFSTIPDDAERQLSEQCAGEVRVGKGVVRRPPKPAPLPNAHPSTAAAAASSSRRRIGGSLFLSWPFQAFLLKI